MIRQVSRFLRSSPPCLHATPTRRLVSTAPPAQKSRSWKSSATRWGLAIGAIYYYNTSTLFAEEPPFAIPPPSVPSDETPLPTLESLAPLRQKPSTPSPTPPTNTTLSITTTDTDLETTEEEASQEGAFNEATGEINWECPCLGGMAHGPCGEQFRAAFSCFIFSKEEPKGMDCIEHFKGMQNCFREFPEVYGAELDDEEEEGNAADGGLAAEGEAVTVTARSAAEPIPAAATSAAPESHTPPAAPSAGSDETERTERAKAAKEQVERDHAGPMSESDELVPKAAHDATSANVGK